MSPLEAVPADWGLYTVDRLASAAEMDEAGYRCGDCADPLTVHGTVIGYRAAPTDRWVWTAPLCRPCDRARAVADGCRR